MGEGVYIALQFNVVCMLMFTQSASSLGEGSFEQILLFHELRQGRNQEGTWWEGQRGVRFAVSSLIFYTAILCCDWLTNPLSLGWKGVKDDSRVYFYCYTLTLLLFSFSCQRWAQGHASVQCPTSLSPCPHSLLFLRLGIRNFTYGQTIDNENNAPSCMTRGKNEGALICSLVHRK